MPEITPELLLRAYAHGLFPMASSADARQLHWFDPPERGILPLDRFHVPRSLKKLLRRLPWQVRLDTAFDAVIDGCAEPAADRPRTWINAEIRRLYGALHAEGFGHSVEVWDGPRLVGGLYGVSLAAAFMGESMFSRVADASKAALVHLVALLRALGFMLLDTQFTTDHLRRFGGLEIPRADYHRQLATALTSPVTFREVDYSGELARLIG